MLGVGGVVVLLVCPVVLFLLFLVEIFPSIYFYSANCSLSFVPFKSKHNHAHSFCSVFCLDAPVLIRTLFWPWSFTLSDNLIYLRFLSHNVLVAYMSVVFVTVSSSIVPTSFLYAL